MAAKFHSSPSTFNSCHRLLLYATKEFMHSQRTITVTLHKWGLTNIRLVMVPKKVLLEKLIIYSSYVILFYLNIFHAILLYPILFYPVLLWHPILFQPILFYLIKSITDLVDKWGSGPLKSPSCTYTFHSDNMNLLRILDDKFLRTVMIRIYGDVVSLP